MAGRKIATMRRLMKLALFLSSDGIAPNCVESVIQQLCDVLHGLCARYSVKLEDEKENVRKLHLEKRIYERKKSGGYVMVGRERDIQWGADRHSIDYTYKQAKRKFGGDVCDAYCDILAPDGSDSALIDGRVTIAALGRIKEAEEDLESEAKKLIGKLLDTHRIAIKNLPKSRQDTYLNIKESGGIPVLVDIFPPKSWLRPTVTRHANDTQTPLPRFDKHLLCDPNDNQFPEKTDSPWESDVINGELAHATTIAWYRNPSFNSRESLGIVSEMDGEKKIMRPDFIFFGKAHDGTITASIVDPHGTQYPDSLPKLQGLAKYAEKHSDHFARIDSIAKIGEDYLVLDMTNKRVRQAVASGDAVVELYKTHGQPYP